MMGDAAIIADTFAKIVVPGIAGGMVIGIVTHLLLYGINQLVYIIRGAGK